MYEEIINRVKAAYEKIGLKPRNRGWYFKGACCPLVALAIAEGGILPEEGPCMGPRVIAWADSVMDSDWIFGFWRGVDDPSGIRNYYRGTMLEGYQAGQAVAKAILVGAA